MRGRNDDGSIDQATAAAKARVLVDALPYIQRFAGKVVVVKYGGNALAGAVSDDDALKLFAQDIVLLASVGMRPVVVHGGGPQISDLMSKLGKVPEFRDGRRVTDAATVDIARMVLKGQVNPQLVSAINTQGGKAIGLSGEDASILRTSVRDAALGFVGEVDTVDTRTLLGLVDQGIIPVIAPIGAGPNGQAHNVNADTAAGAIGAALGAEKLVYLTDIEGIRRDVDDAASLIRQTSATELQRLIDAGIVVGGMIPKVESCIWAVTNGVKRAHILDGRIPHVLLLEFFTDEGIGTMVIAK